MFLYMLVVDIKNDLILFNNTQPMVAELWLTDPLQELAVGVVIQFVGERMKEHMAKIANNLSALAEDYQKLATRRIWTTSRFFAERIKLIPHKVREAIFKERDQPHPQ